MSDQFGVWTDDQTRRVIERNYSDTSSYIRPGQKVKHFVRFRASRNVGPQPARLYGHHAAYWWGQMKLWQAKVKAEMLLIEQEDFVVNP